MQDLFKAGIVFLLLQAIAFMMAPALNVNPPLSAFIVMAVFSVLLVVQSKPDTDQRMLADLAATYAFSAFVMQGVLSGSLAVAAVFLIIGLLFMAPRILQVASYLSKRPEKPEQFRHALLGALPLGIGIIASFVVIWNRTKPQR